MVSVEKTIKILIVEDEPIVAIDLQDMLTGMGYGVSAILQTGEEAVRAMRDDPSDLILMDIMLKGGSDGVAAARRIRQRHDIPIIYITANADDRTIERARDTVPYGYLIKPINERDLHSNIDSAIIRHRTERALRESEQRFRTIFEAANDSIMIHDIETGAVIDANRTAISSYGFDRLEQLQRNEFWIEPPFSRDDAARWIHRAAETGQQTFEWLNRTQDGREFWEEVNLTRIIFGGIECILSVSRDITERKRMERELRESEELYRSLVETSPDAIIMSDLEGNITFANLQAANLLGYDTVEEYVLGARNVFAPIAPRDRQRAAENATRTLETGAIRGIEYEIQRRGGNTFPAELGASVVHDAAQVPRGFIAVVRDISERKRAEEELREIMSELQAIYDSQSDGVGIIDAETRRFMRVNRAMTELFGFAEEEFLRLAVGDIHTPDVYPRMYEKFTNMRSGGREIALGIACRRKDGGVFFADIACRKITFKGRQSLLASFRDITERIRLEDERRKLEEQLRQAQKMESIGRLAGGVAHDFNNLLTVIMGNVSLALTDVPAVDPTHKTLEVVMRAVESAAALTRQLLAFSRKQLIEPRSVNLNEIIGTMRDILERLSGESVHLHLDLAPDIGYILADASQLEQVIVNLVTNARDAMPNGGTLTIETAERELDLAFCQEHPEIAPGSYVQLSVRDTGVGMAPEILKNIFEPFFTTKPHGKGTGLGLSTVYGAVKQNGGALLVSSQQGAGTAFTVFLPRLADPEIEPVAEETMEDIPGGTETIMLVEDEPIVRDLTLTLLSRLGYRVLHYGGAGEALIALEGYAEPVHLLLTDIIMPGMNGRELARLVAGKRPETKFLFTSGYVGTSTVANELLDEDLNFIPKPFLPRALAEKVREVLDR